MRARHHHGKRRPLHGEAGDRASGGSAAHAPRLRGEGEAGKARADKRARGGGNWIKGAIKRPGALHRALHVPEGQKIPAAKLQKAAHSDNPRLRQEANLAKTLKKMH